MGRNYHPFTIHPQQDIDGKQKLVLQISYGVLNNLREASGEKNCHRPTIKNFYHAVS
jgi:hypothetical protein